MAAQKTHHAHGGADVERQFFNVYLAVGERHKEKVGYVQPERDIGNDLGRASFNALVLAF